MLSQVSRNENSYLLGSATVNQESVLGNILSLFMDINHKHSQVFSYKHYPVFFIIIKKKQKR